MNTNEITVKETSGAVVAAEDFKKTATEYLKSMGSKLPEKHLTQFVNMAAAFKLNPFKREIYAVGYGENWNIITGYEVYIKRAERTGKLDGWKVETSGDTGNMAATITIYRKDWHYPFTHTVLLSECAQKTKDGELTSVWAKMTSFMLRKVAISQGFRLCFPDELGGMPYTSEELPEIETRDEVRTEDLASAAIDAQEVKPAPAPKKEKPKYTKAQAAELGAVMNSLDPDGKPIFTDQEKETAREMLINGNFAQALQAAKECKAEKEKAYNTVEPAPIPNGLRFSPEVEAEINAEIDATGIF